MQITKEQLAERFCKLAGIHLHNWDTNNWTEDRTLPVFHFVCKDCGEYSNDLFTNPTFSHPEEVLAVMMKRDDWSEFSLVVGCWYEHPKSVRYFYIRYDYITTKDKLLQAACDFLEEKK
jgi:hypothetical protein